MMSTRSSSRPAASIEEFELSEYVRALASSSNHVRYLVFALVVTSAVLFVSYQQVRQKGWTNSRVALAEAAVRNQVWAVDPAVVRTCDEKTRKAVRGVENQDQVKAIEKRFSAQLGLKDPCGRVLQAITYSNLYRLEDRQMAEEHLKRWHQARTDHVLVMNVPFLGTSFDVNDLGIFSGIAFSLFMVTLAVAMYRNHENLYLSLWKVDQLSREADGHQKDGKANLLYHSLAMTQLFTKPPTLARWQGAYFYGFLAKLLYFVPLSMQVLILGNDLKTLHYAAALNDRALYFWGLWVHGTSIAVISIATIYCLLYSRAGDREWSRAFFLVNPSLKSVKQPPFLDWIRGQREVLSWGIAVDGQAGEILFSDIRSGLLWRWRNNQGLEVAERRRTRQLFFDKESGGFYCDHSVKGSKLTEVWKVGGGESLGPFRGAGVVRDGNGNSYLFDSEDFRLYRVTSQGQRIQIAGALREYSDGLGGEVGFEWVRAIAMAPDGVLYLSDGPCVRKVDPSGAVSTLGRRPLADRHCWRHRLLGLEAPAGRVVVADYDERCVWELSTPAGERRKRWSSSGLWSPTGVTVDAQGTLYVLEHRSRGVLGRLFGWIGPWLRVWRIPPEESRDKGTRIATIGWWKRWTARRLPGLPSTAQS